MTTPTLRLDKSKPFSEVHGDRTPEDPDYLVHYMQDGLPYDASGLLVADDGKTEPWREARVDDATGAVKHIHHNPLYTAEMRKRVERKLARIAGVKGDELAPVDDDVNLEAWLRGEIDYPGADVYAAIERRFHKRIYRLADAIDFLIYDRKVLPEGDVHAQRMAALDAVV